MSLSGGVVLYALLWFLCLFGVLPLRIRTQAEVDEVVRDTPPSAPTNPGLGWKVVAATCIAAVLWSIVHFAIVLEVVTLADLDRLFG